MLEEKAGRVFRPDVAKSTRGLLHHHGIRFRELSFPLLSPEDQCQIRSEIIEHHLWQLNRVNFESVLRHCGVAEKEILRCPVTSLISLNNPQLVSYIFENIETFTRNCFLQIEESVHEAPEGLGRLLQFEELKPETVTAIIRRQNSLLSFNAVNPEYWETLIEFEKFEISWENLDYLAMARSESNPSTKDETSLADIILQEQVSKTLAQSHQPVGAALRQSVYSNDALDHKHYLKLAQRILGELEELPEPLGLPKRRHLAAQGLIELSEDAITWAGDDPELIAILISVNRDTFFTDPETYVDSLNNQVIFFLLDTDLDLERKRFLCSHLSPNSLNSPLATKIESVVRESEPPFGFLDDEITRSLVALPKNPHFDARANSL